MSYARRRYRVVDGILEKANHGSDEDGWVKTKAEAWGEVIEGKPQDVDWERPWLAVKADLVALGFDGRTKADALVWASENGVSVPE